MVAIQSTSPCLKFKQRQTKKIPKLLPSYDSQTQAATLSQFAPEIKLLKFCQQSVPLKFNHLTAWSDQDRVCLIIYLSWPPHRGSIQPGQFACRDQRRNVSEFFCRNLSNLRDLSNCCAVAEALHEILDHRGSNPSGEKN